MHSTMLWQDHTSDTSSVAATQQRAKVARVCNTINCNKKWHHTISFCHQCIEICFF
jgi:hypothetical protein